MKLWAVTLALAACGPMPVSEDAAPDARVMQPDAGPEAAADAPVADNSPYFGDVIVADVGPCGSVAYTMCGNTCSYLPEDANNCGACGNMCPAATPLCRAGQCVCDIPGQFASCMQSTFGLVSCSPGDPGCFCKNVYGDTSNCGACGNTCSTLECRNGSCS